MHEQERLSHVRWNCKYHIEWYRAVLKGIWIADHLVHYEVEKKAGRIKTTTRKVEKFQVYDGVSIDSCPLQFYLAVNRKP